MDFRANEYNQTSSLSNKQQRFLRSHKGPRGVHSSPFPELKQVCPFFLCYFADHQRSPSRDEGLRRLRPEFRTWSTEESFLNYVFSLCNYIELLVFSLSLSFFFRCRSAVLSSLLSGGACPFTRKAPGWLDAVGGMVAWNVSANFSLLWRRCWQRTPRNFSMKSLPLVWKVLLLGYTLWGGRGKIRRKKWLLHTAC